MFCDVPCDDRESHITFAKNNVKVIDQVNNWNILLLKEALQIKEKMPLLNFGLKEFSNPVH